MFGALRRYGNKHWAGGEDAAPVTGSPDMPFKDRALMALALLNKDYGAAVNIKQMAGKSAAAQAAAAAQAEIPNILTGRTHAKAYNGVAGPTTDGSQPAATSIPFAQRRAMLPNLRDPEVIRRLAEVEARGGDIGSAMEILKANQLKLEAVNNELVDTGDPQNIGRQLPETSKGQMRLYDGQGRPYIVNADGFVKAEAEREGAVAAAKSAGEAPYTFETYTDETGAPHRAAVSTMVGKDFVGQREADKARDVDLAKAQAGAEANLPSSTQTAIDTRALIQQIREHPGRKLGTGATGVIPGIPGTAQKDFVTLLDQAKGRAFLEAFATLRGGGQITQVEGEKATAAIARLDRTQSEEGFLAALDDLEAVVNAAEGRDKEKAGMRAPQTAVRPSRTAMEAELRRRGLIK